MRALVDARVRLVAAIRRVVRLQRAPVAADAPDVSELSRGEVRDHVLHRPPDRRALIEHVPPEVGRPKAPHDGVEGLVFGLRALEHARARVLDASADVYARPLHTSVLQRKAAVGTGGSVPRLPLLRAGPQRQPANRSHPRSSCRSQAVTTSACLTPSSAQRPQTHTNSTDPSAVTLNPLRSPLWRLELRCEVDGLFRHLARGEFDEVDEPPD